MAGSQKKSGLDIELYVETNLPNDKGKEKSVWSKFSATERLMLIALLISFILPGLIYFWYKNNKFTEDAQQNQSKKVVQQGTSKEISISSSEVRSGISSENDKCSDSSIASDSDSGFSESEEESFTEVQGQNGILLDTSVHNGKEKKDFNIPPPPPLPPPPSNTQQSMESGTPRNGDGRNPILGEIESRKGSPSGGVRTSKALFRTTHNIGGASKPPVESENLSHGDGRNPILGEIESRKGSPSGGVRTPKALFRTTHNIGGASNANSGGKNIPSQHQTYEAPKSRSAENDARVKEALKLLGTKNEGEILKFITEKVKVEKKTALIDQRFAVLTVAQRDVIQAAKTILIQEQQKKPIQPVNLSFKTRVIAQDDGNILNAINSYPLSKLKPVKDEEKNLYAQTVFEKDGITQKQ